jgi:anti-sigma regulatory factor (Ser/Thr protein kinase)
MADGFAMILKNDLAEVTRANVALAELLTRHNASASMEQVAGLALEEILVNIISHAYAPGEAKTIEFSAAFRDALLYLRFEDSGPPFDPTRAPEPDTNQKLDDRPIGGLGLHLVRKMVQRMAYERRGDKNVLEISIAAS